MTADKGQQDLFSETEVQKTFRELKDISTELIGFHVRMMSETITLRQRVEALEEWVGRIDSRLNKLERGF